MGPWLTAFAGGILVEREAELDRIERALAAVGGGGGSVLVFAGPAGIGKTALLQAARERASAAGMQVLGARGAEFEGDFPYGIVRQLLEPAIRRAVPERAERLLTDAGEPGRAALLGDPAAPGNPAERTFVLLNGLQRVVANLAAEAPLILLVDDLQWADLPSTTFLAHLARRLDRLPVALIASVRSGDAQPDGELLDGLADLAFADLSTPAPLSEAGVAMVLAGAFDEAPGGRFAAACLEATGGNPFYLHELASALHADGVEPVDDAAATVAAVAPRTVADAMSGRLAKLPADALALARAVAVLDRDATMPRVAALAGLSGDDAAAALDSLVAAELFAADTAEGPHFRHPILRAAVYGNIPPGSRSGAHRTAAKLLGAEGAELEAIAGHLFVSYPAKVAETVAILRRAAVAALALGVPQSAAALLARALAEPPPDRETRVEVLLELGEAESLARMPDAVGRFEEVLRIAEDPAMRARAMLEEAGIVLYAGDRDRLLELLDAALAELGQGGGELRLRAEAIRAGATMYDPRLVAAFRERLPVLRELAAGEASGVRPLALLLAAWEAQRGAPPAAVAALVERAWDGGRYVDEGGSIELLPQAIGALVAVERFDEAAAIVERIRELARQTGSVVDHVTETGHEALVRAHRGDLAGAGEQMRACIEEAVELGLMWPVACVIWYCIDALLERPDLADVAGLAESLELGPMAGTQTAALFLDARGRLRLLAGHLDAGVEDLREAGAINDAIGFDSSYALASWRSNLGLALRAAAPEEARALVDAELADARASGDPRRLGVALRAEGMLAGDRDAGIAALEEAVATLATVDARLERARTLVELGAALRRRGRRADCRGPLRESLDLATHCGAERLAERARAELAASGAKPRRDTVTGRDALTASELRVARLAAEGRTNREIAEALFVTIKTVDTHLSRTYAKLGINSRTKLPEVLGGPDPSSQVPSG